MRIAIIGTGKMGIGLGRQLAAAGHEVRVGSRHPMRGEQKAEEIRASFGGSYLDAADRVEALILAVPWQAVPETLKQLGDLDGTFLIDVTNPLKEGSVCDLYEFPGSSGAEELQSMVPGAYVVKAWNCICHGILRRSPDFEGTAATLFVASDDPLAKQAVFGLARDTGYDPVDAGPLSSARCLEHLMVLMATLDRTCGRGDHALKLLTRPLPAKPARDRPVTVGASAAGGDTPGE